MISLFFFFFQAEDGIRDVAVTGVQTCALPIYCLLGRLARHRLHTTLGFRVPAELPQTVAVPAEGPDAVEPPHDRDRLRLTARLPARPDDPKRARLLARQPPRSHA